MAEPLKSFSMQLVENPLNWILLTIVFYLGSSLIFPVAAHQHAVPSKHNPVILYRKFTRKDLSIYNGLKDKSIYMGINGHVFDVSSAPSYYGPGSMYGNFAGQDASRGLAKNSFDQDVLTPLEQPMDTLLDLDDEERASLGEWKAFFSNKYALIGDLVD